MARRFEGSRLLVATHNRGKAGEIRTMLAISGSRRRRRPARPSRTTPP
jgi:hypothetical protein